MATALECMVILIVTGDGIEHDWLLVCCIIPPDKQQQHGEGSHGVGAAAGVGAAGAVAGAGAFGVRAGGGAEACHTKRSNVKALRERLCLCLLQASSQWRNAVNCMMHEGHS